MMIEMSMRGMMIRIMNNSCDDEDMSMMMMIVPKGICFLFANNLYKAPYVRLSNPSGIFI